MDLRVNTLQSEDFYADLISVQGYSLRINAFKAWLEKSKYTMEDVAERIDISQEELIRKLEQHEIFNRKMLTEIVKMMGAKDAFFAIYFPSFRFRRYVYKQVFGRRMKYKRRKWQGKWQK